MRRQNIDKFNELGLEARGGIIWEDDFPNSGASPQKGV